MIDYIYFILILILIYLLNIFLLKKNCILNTTGEAHQNLTSKKKIPLSGGVYIIISFLLFFSQFSLENKIIILSFYLVGFFQI